LRGQPFPPALGRNVSDRKDCFSTQNLIAAAPGLTDFGGIRGNSELIYRHAGCF
jgi:hypothetical protein